MRDAKIRTDEFLDGAGLLVTLEAPKGNVLDAAMMADLARLLDAARARPGLKALCFTGAGDHFSFGASVAEHVKERAPAMLAAFHGLFIRLANLAVPTIAAVRGRCLGGGLELAAFCNRVIAHPAALLGQPEIQLGVVPPVAAVLLPFRLGQGGADDLILSGRTVAAPDAFALGLVDELADDPVAAATAWATRELGPKSASSLRYAVRAARQGLYRALREELPALERLYLDGLMDTHDANEGLAAFLEKRPPRYTNA
ncbi:MAG TPA: enoyl-CoA hydratase/isomerase family protein [Polyangia bacterium]|jgi:cyclohexa-1,5-dienecarbonyl-CoA hydratase